MTKDVVVSVRLNTKQVAAVRRLTKEIGVTRSQLLLRLLDDAVAFPGSVRQRLFPELSRVEQGNG